MTISGRKPFFRRKTGNVKCESKGGTQPKKLPSAVDSLNDVPSTLTAFIPSPTTLKAKKLKVQSLTPSLTDYTHTR